MVSFLSSYFAYLRAYIKLNYSSPVALGFSVKPSTDETASLKSGWEIALTLACSVSANNLV